MIISSHNSITNYLLQLPTSSSSTASSKAAAAASLLLLLLLLLLQQHIQPPDPTLRSSSPGRQLFIFHLHYQSFEATSVVIIINGIIGRSRRCSRWLFLLEQQHFLHYGLLNFHKSSRHDGMRGELCAYDREEEQPVLGNAAAL